MIVSASAGCAPRDWVSDLLVLTDVTGTWEGSVRGREPGGQPTPPIPLTPVTLVLQQTGPKVSGEFTWSRGKGRVEGIVSGEVLTFREGIKVETGGRR